MKRTKYALAVRIDDRPPGRRTDGQVTLDHFPIDAAAHYLLSM